MSRLTSESSEKDDNCSTVNKIEVQTGLVSNRAKYFQTLSVPSGQRDADVNKPCDRMNTCEPKAAEKGKKTSSRKAPRQSPVKSTLEAAPRSVPNEEGEIGNTEAYHTTSAQGSKEAIFNQLEEESCMTIPKSDEQSFTPVAPISLEMHSASTINFPHKPKMVAEKSFEYKSSEAAFRQVTPTSRRLQPASTYNPSGMLNY